MKLFDVEEETLKLLVDCVVTFLLCFGFRFILFGFVFVLFELSQMNIVILLVLGLHQS